MKKLIIVLLLLFTWIIPVTYGATETVNYSISFYADKIWNIETGVFETNTNYWASNRMQIFESEITLNNLNFNHILFWTSSGTYIGYYNSADGYEGTRYLGDTDETVVLPLNASWFALTAYELEHLDFDVTELNNHSLREVFEESNQFVNPYFNTSTFEFNVGGDLYYLIFEDILYLNSTDGYGFAWKELTNQTNQYIYIRYDYKYQTNHGDFKENYHLLSKTHLFTLTFQKSSSILYSNNANEWLVLFPSYQNTGTSMIDNLFSINLTTLGISALNVEEMDYWYGVYEDTLAEDWQSGTTALLFYSVQPTYDREEVIADDRDFTERLDDWVDGFGLGTFMKILISVVIMGGIAFILGLVKANSIIIMVVELILYIFFSVIGWFPLWLVLLIAILLLVSIYLVISGGSKE